MYLDTVIVVSGKGLDSPLRLASDQTKIGELICFSTNMKVDKALKHYS